MNNLFTKSTIAVLITTIFSTLMVHAQCNFSITTADSGFNCRYSIEEVRWTDQVGVVVDTATNQIRNTVTGWGNAGAFSVNSVYNNGYVYYVIDRVNSGRFIGLSHNNDAGANYGGIDFGLYIYGGNGLQLRENSAIRLNTSANLNDTIKIMVLNNKVHYYKNSTCLYVSGITPILPLKVDVSFDQANGQFTPYIANPTYGSFTASETNPGTLPNYQWFLNGMAVGSNNTTYINPNLNPNDIIECRLTPGAGGCAVGDVYANQIRISDELGVKPTSTITTNPTTHGCVRVTESVIWQNNLFHFALPDNKVYKLGSNTWDNGGIRSVNTVEDNSEIFVIPNQTNRNWIVGLNQTKSQPLTNYYTTIDFALFANSGNFSVYELGTNRGNFGAYTVGDTLRLKVEDGQVKYYKNSTLVYVSNVAPVFPLNVDATIYHQNTSMGNVYITKTTQAVFNANLSVVANNPIYQWKINSVNAGNNLATDSLPSITINNTISNIITSVGPNCPAIVSTPALVVNRKPLGFEQPDLRAEHLANSCALKKQTAKLHSPLKATFENGILYLFASGYNTSGMKVSQPLLENGYITSTVTGGGATRKFFGVDANPTSYDYSTFDYCFFLEWNGPLRIFENGTERTGWTTTNYSNNDTLRIENINNTIRYYKNSTLLYESTVTPPDTLYGLFSAFHPAQFKDIYVATPTTGKLFIADSAIYGNGATYNWKYNNISSGINAANANLIDLITENQEIEAIIWPDFGGCSAHPIGTSAKKENLNINKILKPVVENLTDTVSCVTYEQRVIWERAIGINVDANNDLRKLYPASINNSQANSKQKLNEGSYFYTVITETNTERFFGFDRAPSGLGYGIADVGLLFQNNGRIQLYRDGANIVSHLSDYSVGDTIKIELQKNNVYIYRNEVLVYNYFYAPAFPVYVLASFYTANSNLKSIHIGNRTKGKLFLNTELLPGSVSGNWYINQNMVSATDTLNHFDLGINLHDTIQYVYTSNHKSCLGLSFNSPVNYTIPASVAKNYVLGLTAQPKTPACKMATHIVNWAKLQNTQLHNDGSLQKIWAMGDAWPHSHGISHDTISDQSVVYTVAKQVNAYAMFGLATYNFLGDYTNINYAIYLVNDTRIQVYQNGTNIGTYGNYAIGDTLKIKRNGNRIEYYKNSSMFYQSLVLIPSQPLYVDFSFYTRTTHFNPIYISHPVTHQLSTLSTNPLPSNTLYQWQLNGVDFLSGNNVTTSVPDTFDNNDVAQLIINPQLAGCAANPYRSYPVVYSDVDLNSNTNIFIDDSIANPACMLSTKKATFQHSFGVEIMANGIVRKVVPDGWGTAGTFSNEQVGDNCTIYTIAQQTNRAILFGLDKTMGNFLQSDPDFGIYLRNDGRLRAQENSSEITGANLTYAIGDTLKIVLSDSSVRYYRNSTLIYESLNQISGQYYITSNLYNNNGRLGPIFIVRPSQLSFNIRSTPDLGTSTHYQWFVNGIDQSTNSSAFNPNILSQSDSVYAILTPDIAGCANNPFTTDTIILGNNPNNYIYSQNLISQSQPTFCKKITQPVKWDFTQGVSINSSNQIGKHSYLGSSWTNAHGISKTPANNQTEIAMVAFNTNSSLMFGLSNYNRSADHPSIQFAFYLVNNATYRIYESGGYMADLGSYMVGDTFTIKINSGKIEYYRNGNLVFISAKTPVLPLFPDLTINSSSSLINPIYITQPLGESVFTDTTLLASQGHSYKWYINQTEQTVHTSTANLTNLLQPDTIYATLNLSVNGCSTTNYKTNNAFVSSVAPNVNSNIRLDATRTDVGCKKTTETVSYQTKIGVQVSPDHSIKKVWGSAWNTAGTLSNQKFGPNSVIYTIAQQNNAAIIFGLRNGIGTLSQTDPTFGIYIQNNARISVQEGATNYGNNVVYQVGDTLKIAYINGEIKYYLNSTLFFTSPLVPASEYDIVTILHTQDGRFAPIYLEKLVQNDFAVVADSTLGNNPVYDWYLNGVSLGFNNDSLTNIDLDNGDTLSASVIANLPNCLNAPISTGWLVVNNVSGTDNLAILVKPEITDYACKAAHEQVTWNFTRGVDVLHNNKITKPIASSWLNAGTVSFNKVNNNGYVYTLAPATSSILTIGLVDTLRGLGIDSFDFGVQFNNNAILYVREGTSSIYTGVNYSLNDTIKISIEKGRVQYYKNNSVFYVSPKTASGSYYVHYNIHSSGNTANPAYVFNNTFTQFNVVSSASLGTSPAYQWYVNNTMRAGADSSFFADTLLLSHNDSIWCQVTPDIPGCHNNTAETLPVIIKNQNITNGLSVFTQSAGETIGCKTTTTKASWVYTVGANASQSGVLTKSVPSSWTNCGGFSDQQVFNNGYFYTIAAQTNANLMFGLNKVNTTENFTDIDFAIYLQNNNQINIYKEGANINNPTNYATGDTIKVYINKLQIEVYKNSVLVYTDAVQANPPYNIDFSINSSGGQLNPFYIVNPSQSRFEVVADGSLGITPNYNWRVNGVPTGNTTVGFQALETLNNTDTVDCIITPDILGCSNNALTTNWLMVNNTDLFNSAPLIASAPFTDISCQKTIEEIAFHRVYNLNQTNGLFINRSSGFGNSGAISLNQFGDNAMIYTVVTENNTNRAFGIAPNNYTHSLDSLPFSFYLQNNQTFWVREYATNRVNVGYAIGDTLKIWINRGNVEFYKNSTLVFMSDTFISPPYYCDITMNTYGATLGKFYLEKPIAASYAVVSSVDLGSASYDWKVNHVSMSTDSIFTYPNYNDGDSVWCVVTPSFGGCQNSPFVSPVITVKPVPLNTTADVAVTAVRSPIACKTATENVIWTNKRAVKETNRSLRRDYGSGWGNSGAFSINSIENNGSFYFVVEQNNTDRMVGLSRTDANAHYNTIHYAFYLLNNSTLRIYENGTYISGQGNYSIGDTLRISIVRGKIFYYRNSELLYTSLVEPIPPYYVDLSLNSNGAIMEPCFVTNGINAKFSILSSASLGTSPQYQWRVNGVDQSTDATFDYGNLINKGDSVKCQIIPDIAGCVTNPYQGPGLVINEVDLASTLDAFVTTERVEEACRRTTEVAIFTNKNGVQDLPGNFMQKIISGGWGNAGGRSINTITNGGSFYTVLQQTDKVFKIGLDYQDEDYSLNTIDFGLYVNNNGTVRPHEGSVYLSSGVGFVVGDTIRFAVTDNKVHYYLNSNLIYTSLTTPNLPLHIDVAFNSDLTLLGPCYVENLSDGVFNLYTSDSIGANPQSRWFVNGIERSSGGSTLDWSDSLNNGDVIYTVTTPDIGGCNTSQFTSTNVLVSDINLLKTANMGLINNYESYSCLSAREPIIWTNIVGLQNEGNNRIRKTPFTSYSDAYGNSGAFSVNQVFDNGVAFTVINETDKRFSFGLSNSDYSLSNDQIDYVFYVDNNATFRVYEKNTYRAGSFAYAVGDTLKILVNKGTIEYYQNSILRWVSVVTPNLPLNVDLAVRTPNTLIRNSYIQNPTSGRFAITSDFSIPNGSAIWYINNNPIAGTDSTNAIAHLVAGDSLICNINPVVAGCVGKTSTLQTVYMVSNPNALQPSYYITPSVEANPCQQILAPVWFTDTTKVSWDGVTLRKSRGNSGWGTNAGAAFSVNTVLNHGSVSTIVDQLNYARFIGLSSVNTNADYSTIQYAFYLQDNNTLSVWEKGSNLGGHGTYSLGDSLTIAIEDRVVKYYRNGVLLRTSLVVPTLPLYVDVSIRNLGGQLSDVSVINDFDGSLTLTGDVYGIDPKSYWVFNGSVADSNQNVYPVTAEQYDWVYGLVNPNLPGCNIIDTTPIFRVLPGRLPSQLDSTLWLGANSDFADPVNWSNGLPYKGRKAIIDGSAIVSPVVDGQYFSGDLDIRNGAGLSLSPTSNLIVYRNLNLNQDILSGNGKITFEGCYDTAFVNLDHIHSVSKIEINKTGSVVINSHKLLVTDSVIFNNGIVLGQGGLLFGHGSKYIGVNGASYIGNRAYKVGSEDFMLPVGDAGLYRPIGFTAPADIADTVAARYVRQSPDSVGSRDSIEFTLDHISDCEYWLVDRISGNSPIQLILSFDTSSCGIDTLSQLRVTKWDGTKWLDLGNGGFSGDTASGTLYSQIALPSFSPVTLASETPYNPLPNVLIGFNGKLDNNMANLEWMVVNPQLISGFTLERADLNNQYQPIAQLVASHNQHYKYSDKITSQNVLRYRLRVMLTNGQEIISNIVEFSKPNSSEKFEVFPNPFVQSVSVRIPEGTTLINLNDANGKVLKSITPTHSTQQAVIYTDDLPSGAYIIGLFDPKLGWTYKQIVKGY